MENKEIVIKGKGIKVNILSGIFIAIGVITMIASIFVIKKIYVTYDEMTNSYQNVEVQREAAESFQEASDYLTDQSRRFVVTGDVKNTENYFEEINDTKRREAAIDVIENSHMLNLECELLYNAMELSESLAKQEIHAMKLSAVAMKLDESKLPDEIASYELSGDELNLNSTEQQNLAIHLLYNSEYEDYKNRINWDINNAITLIKDESGTRYRENESSLIIVLNIATLLIFVMFILLMLIFIFNILLVVNPAKKFVELLDKGEKLPEIGGYEFRKFARRYNDIYRSNKKNRELLREQGEVDDLTGTLKAGTLELVRHNLTQTNESLGIMLIDIDNFRSIKEANGYDMADKVVAKVANLFITSFKRSDYIIRTSQDEFEIFLLRMQQQDSNMLIERIDEINRKLKDTSDGVMEASVSVGVSFSENGYTVEAERKADMALNSVKENGRGACKI
ncbi:MAG: GGDEF domain-containing protein, partial [Lachnospiraceae bacterium]|nr:GGDEF domain-containing protein [Lachnospiraceae bacterium]